MRCLLLWLFVSAKKNVVSFLSLLVQKQEDKLGRCVLFSLSLLEMCFLKAAGSNLCFEVPEVAFHFLFFFLRVSNFCSCSPAF